jgi:Uma2 family endonuclease
MKTGPIMTTTTDIYSYRDYLEVVDEKRKAHLLDGIIVMESPASFRHEELQSFLTVLIGMFVTEKGLGTVYGGHAAYKLDQHNVVEPDLSFVSRERRSIVQTHYASGPPDLAVEIISKGTRHIDHRKKRPAYERAGTPELWLIDHLHEEAEFLVLEAGRFAAAKLERNRYFDSQVLQGFRVDTRWFWSDPLPKPATLLRKLLK